MRRAAIQIMAELQTGSKGVSELAAAIGKSVSWTSEVVSDLANQQLVTTNGGVSIADTYEANLLTVIITEYEAEDVLTGKREEVLRAISTGPRTVSELERRGFSTSTVYEALTDLQAVGVLAETDEGYDIADETVREFLKARYTDTAELASTTTGERVIAPTGGDADGTRTAFSAFERYGVSYYPSEEYVYQGDRELEIADVLIHATACASNQKQMGMCGVFFLKHRATLDTNELWHLAGEWDIVERWADLQAYLDQRDVDRADLFPPWEEFTDLARDYDVYPRGKYLEDNLLAGLEEIGEALDTRVDAHLLGGANLILRGLKDTTKDIDVVVEDRTAYSHLVTALQEVGYEERKEVGATYEELAPSVILEKDEGPRWDIFVTVVADALHLTDGMQSRKTDTKTFGNLYLHLLSLTDIFMFKAVTDREGDLEDAALIARQGAVEWDQLLSEIEVQEARTDTYFSFSVLDTLDILHDHYDISAPIRDRLASYCLEHALLLTLDEPKTIRDLRTEVSFPDHQIYNKLQKLESEGDIVVDRSGKLNSYRVAS